MLMSLAVAVLIASAPAPAAKAAPTAGFLDASSASPA